MRWRRSGRGMSSTKGIAESPHLRPNPRTASPFESLMSCRIRWSVLPVLLFLMTEACRAEVYLTTDAGETWGREFRRWREDVGEPPRDSGQVAVPVPRAWDVFSVPGSE